MPVTVRIESEALYEALRQAGVEETPARRATASVVSATALEHLVSKTDLELALSRQTTELTRRLGALIVVGLGVATTILGLLITRSGQ